MLKFSVFVMLLASVVVGQKVRYDSYRVFRVIPQTAEQISVLHEISNSIDGSFSFWNGPTYVNTTADLMVAPEKLDEFVELMRLTGTKYETYIDNVQDLIDEENPVRSELVRVNGFNWKSYHTLEEINAWLDQLAATYPDIVTVIVGGQTYEGRQIKGVKVSFKADNPGVFIEGNIHAREWITSATVTYILNELLTSPNPEVRQLAESNDWYIFPVVNPDGFVYTHTTQRLWRKTRKPYGLVCRGTDPNRNWAYKWNEGGSSNLPCAETYAGSGPNSDVEIKTLSQYITSIGGKLYAYIAFHSYSQLLLFPYGHTTAHLDNYDELRAIGVKTIEAISQRYGTQYVTGNIAETIYVATGNSMDWAKATFKLPITYTYELRDKGKYGFVLPANQIVPTGEETLDSLVALFKEASARGIPYRR